MSTKNTAGKPPEVWCIEQNAWRNLEQAMKLFASAELNPDDLEDLTILATYRRIVRDQSRLSYARPGRDDEPPSELRILTPRITRLCTQYLPSVDPLVFQRTEKMILGAYEEHTKHSKPPGRMRREIELVLDELTIKLLSHRQPKSPMYSDEMSLKTLAQILGVKDVRTARKRATESYGLKLISRERFQIDLAKLSKQDRISYERYCRQAEQTMPAK